MSRLLAAYLLAAILGGCATEPAANDVAPRSVPATMTPASQPIPRSAAYTGDAPCAACHPGIAETYRQTNKARAITRFSPSTAIERFDRAVVHDTLRDLSYEVFVRGDTLYQREFRRDADGRLTHERTHPAAYVIGSGNATRSYLMAVNGYLTEMPVTWYVHRGKWDLSPGYREANDRFGRQINLACISCHNGPVTHVPFTQNRYEPLDPGITCERCHGPASDHVAARRAGPRPAGPDPTIVNPARLDRDARLSICQQCHLAGILVFKEGEDPTTYQPGRPLSGNRTVFVPEGELTGEESVGIDSHPVRLSRSACYRNSAMTCTTCHDPHRPATLLEPDHYNNACRNCHTPGGEGRGRCSRPGAHDTVDRGNCVSCHLRQGGTTNVPHVIFTDHWIRKNPGPPRNPDAGRPAFDQPDPLHLVALQQAGRGAHVIAPRTTRTASDDLERAVAYFDFYETMHRVPAYIDTVLFRARRGFARGADLTDARIALARALAEADSLEAAVGVLREAARHAPDHAWVQFWLGAFEADRGHLAEARTALERAVALQPYLIEAQSKLADVLFRDGQVAAARRQLETVVTLDPVHQPRAWYNLGIARQQMGAPDSAAAAFERAVLLEPDLAEAHLQLGSYYLARQALDDAARSFTRAIRAAPDNPAGYGSLGLVYLRAGRTREARRMFEKVLALDPRNEAARDLLRQRH